MKNKYTYKEIKFEVYKTDPVAGINWYWLINGRGGDDWFSTKKNAILACKDYIDNNLKKNY